MKTYMYNVKHRQYEDQLCALETRALFGFELEEKVFFSSIEVNPSISPYIKNRLRIIYRFSSLEEIIDQIKQEVFCADDFFVKYVPLTKDDAFEKDRKSISKRVGYVITGLPSFDKPKLVYGIAYYKDFWYFGQLAENDPAWRDHKDKPFTYSSSIDMNLAKALLNIGTRGDMTKSIVDPCCGVGTVLLEGHFAGYDICGWEINGKVAESARGNLDFYHYPVNVRTGDIADIQEIYDVSIVDLPYGNFTPTTKANQVKILKHAKRISKRLVLVSSEDMTRVLADLSIKVIDHCSMSKRSNRNFVRHVWVCECCIYPFASS